MRGFTLIETLITTAILVTGLVAVAAVFSYSAGANVTTRQRTTAVALLSEKMEQFKSASLTGDAWREGGVLNPLFPAAGYFDYATIDNQGSVMTSAVNSSFPYVRVWRIEGGMPRKVTIAVYNRKSAFTGQSVELIRAATVKSSGVF
ncbi:MAG: prepilin-type N-terminal cleavage/methylation domain-containing protein [Acidobacteria bacterium]|nr:prepilin-type N-terminal cleavage/methylation domain-containing protein [Acidobacteriota bacterium]